MTTNQNINIRRDSLGQKSEKKMNDVYRPIKSFSILLFSKMHEMYTYNNHYRYSL